MATDNRPAVEETTPKSKKLASEAAETPKQTPEKAKAKTKPEGPKESSYTITELTKAHKTFKTSYEIVAVALKLAGVERATVTEAAKIINAFKNKEVK